MSQQKQGDSFGWELHSELSDPPEHKEEARTPRQESDHRVKELTYRCSILEQEKQQLMKLLFDKEESLAAMQKHINSQNTHCRTKQHSWDEASHSFKAELAGLNRQVSELLDVIKTNKDEISALSMRVNQTTEANQLLKARMESISKELEEYKAENSELAQEIKQLKFGKPKQNVKAVLQDKRGYQTARNHRADSAARSRPPLQQTNRPPSGQTAAEHQRKLSDFQRTSIIQRLKNYRQTCPKGSDFDQFLRTLRQLQ